MVNAPRKKGTGGETELVNLLNACFKHAKFQRTPASATYDIEKSGHYDTILDAPLNVLAIRPDRGRWLMMMDLPDWVRVMTAYPDLFEIPLHIEVKRFQRSAVHSIYEHKFGEKK